jgi:selenocysteine lyase/cysteine desulfurase
LDKRSFIRNLTFGTMGLSMGKPKLQEMMIDSNGQSPLDTASDDEFWKQVRKGYRLKGEYINLENGYYNFIPEETLEKYIAHIREVNFQGQHYMRTVQWDNKKKVAARLAGMLDCGDDELIITRNTTESLDTVIAGYPWKAGDEALMAEQDYGAMLDMFKQVAERHGIVNRMVSVPNHPSSDEEIVSLYERAITPKTKMLMVCHMINITGQILPVRKICDMAHRKGVKVLVDGAHCVAHIRFSLRELGCDYYGASLHKWLSVPLGAGILYVNKKNVAEIWPMFGDGPRPKDDIMRLNHTGTHPCATDLAISDAIDFYNKIGADRKEARLRYLQRYWTSRARKLKGVYLNTPEDPARSCGIANVGIEGMSPETMAKTLLSKYRIFTVAIDYANVHGCRITPNLYTTTEELDAFVKALGEMGAGAA